MPKERSWLEIHSEFKILFPEIEAETAEGALIEATIHDCACKVVRLFQGKEPAERYVQKYAKRPLDGLKEDIELAANVLAFLRQGNYGKDPRPVSAMDIAKFWGIDPNHKPNGGDLS